jgi:formiminotetrahydrofolate cyclodeaminase
MSGYGERGLSEFLDLVAARESAPGGGSVAAVTVALAASLTAMSARFASFAGAEQVAERANELRRRATALADADAAAYGAVLAKRRAARVAGSPASGERMQRLLLRATEVPLEVGDIAAEVAGMAARLVRDGNPNLRGDAATGILLAEAGTRSTALLVQLNVAELAGPAEALVRQAERNVATAAAAHRSIDLPG